MKVNFFTPLPPEKSGIADHSMVVLNALKDCCDLNVYTHSLSKIDYQFNFKVINLNEQFFKSDECNLNREINFFNIGSNVVYHGWMLGFLKIMPAYVILHDLDLFDLIYGRYNFQGAGDFVGLRDAFSRYYFSDRDIIEKIIRGKVKRPEIKNNYNFLQFFAENSLGVIAHSQAIFKLLDNDLYKLGKIDLACDAVFKQKAPKNNSIHNLVLFGFISFNRMWKELFEALATFEGKERYKLTIFGELAEKEEMQKFIAKNKLENIIEILGYLSPEKMSEIISNSDLSFNLRNPTMGESSSSLLKLWDYEVATIVSDVGWYSELPDDCVTKINNENAVVEIKNILQDFLNNKEKYVKKAKNAKEAILNLHSPKTYAQNLIKFAESYNEDMLKYTMRQLTDRVAKKSFSLLNESEHLKQVSLNKICEFL